MNLLLLILIGSTLGAMFLWSVHIDRQRSEKKARKEDELVASSCKKWATGDPDDQN
jgi:hypothetical protein